MAESEVHPVGPGRAELEALCAVTAAAVEMADAVRNEAAAALLRRALSLVRGRCAAGERAFRPS